MVRKALAASVALLLVSLSTAARAQPTANDRFWAKQRANEGRRLLAARRITEACAKFAESYQRVPDSGALLDLAICHEKEGKTATAYAEFQKARELVRQDSNAYFIKVRTRTADARIKALEPKLSRLTILVAPDAPGDLVVERDGAALKSDEIGKPVAVDPGQREVSATASGFDTWRTTVTIGNRADKKTVTIPALHPVVAAPTAAPAEPISAAPSPTVRALPKPDQRRPDEPAPRKRTQTAAVYLRSAVGAYFSDARTIGGVGGGIGVRVPVGQWPFLQLDASYLLTIGNAALVRAGVGLQRPGLYTPAATLLISTYLGTGLRFLTEDHPVPIEAPAVAAGLHLAPLRFTKGSTHASLLEGGVGVGTDLPGLALVYEATLLEVGASF